MQAHHQSPADVKAPSDVLSNQAPPVDTAGNATGPNASDLDALNRRSQLPRLHSALLPAVHLRRQALSFAQGLSAKSRSTRPMRSRWSDARGGHPPVSNVALALEQGNADINNKSKNEELAEKAEER